MSQLKLTPEELRLLRDKDSMKPFTLYIDETTKLMCKVKLHELGVDTEKGSIAALIRVLMRHFADGDPIKYSAIAEEVLAEYTYTTKKNKRSSM